MSQTKLLLYVAVGGFLALSAPSTNSQPVGPVPAEAPPPRPAKPKVRPPVLITAKLNRTHAQPGDLVRLTELVPVDREIRVNSVSHTVHIIGQYDLGTNNLVNRDPEKSLYSSGDLVFDGWRGDTSGFGDGHFLFDVTNPRQEGFEFEFKARQLGIYLIKATWGRHRTGDAIEGNPVILTVSPPLGKDGKPIIKEEWVDPITWKHRPK